MTLNRPDSLNSLTATMLDGIADALDPAATDPRSRSCGRPARAAVSARVPVSAPRIRPRRPAG